MVMQLPEMETCIYMQKLIKKSKNMSYSNLKYLFLFLLSSLSQTAFLQENKLGFSLEYAQTLSRLTNGQEIEKFKTSHHATFRISYNAKGNINPSVGLGFLNTGGRQFKDFSKQIFQGQIEVENIYHYNYLYIPIGAKIKFYQFYVLPELGFGVMVPSNIKEITTRPNLNDERIIEIIPLHSEEFNAFTIPILLTIGTDFKLGNYSLSTGIKGYYGLNQVTKTELRNDHYFGIGLILAITL